MGPREPVAAGGGSTAVKHRSSLYRPNPMATNVNATNATATDAAAATSARAARPPLADPAGSGRGWMAALVQPSTDRTSATAPPISSRIVGHWSSSIPDTTSVPPGAVQRTRSGTNGPSEPLVMLASTTSNRASI